MSEIVRENERPFGNPGIRCLLVSWKKRQGFATVVAPRNNNTRPGLAGRSFTIQGFPLSADAFEAFVRYPVTAGFRNFICGHDYCRLCVCRLQLLDGTVTLGYRNLGVL